MGLHSKLWIARHVNDPYVKLTRLNGYASRATYKLSELYDRHNTLFRPGSIVIDCGASPGGWTEFVAKRVNPGFVIGIDILPAQKLMTTANARFLQLDLTHPASTPSIKNALLELSPRNVDHHPRIVDTVLSDMAPNFSGNKSIDRLRTHVLVESAFVLSKQVLRKGGHFVCKIFQGPEFNLFRKELALDFEKVYYEKPRSSRSESSEGYLVALRRKS